MRITGLALAAFLAGVTGCGSSAGASAPPLVTLHPTLVGAVVHATVLGANSTASFDPSIEHQSDAYVAAGMRAGRWPGGSVADEYDWQTTTGCRAKSYVWKNASFDNYVRTIAQPAGLDVEITVNYGSSGVPACIAPGSPELAAAWVRYANITHHDGIRWWEVGNEVYGSWETDQHALPHDAATYATTFGDYARLMRAADPSIHVGLPVSPGVVDPTGTRWDQYVLSHANFDYVDLHFYAQQPGKEDDVYLVNTAPQKFAGVLATLKAELAAARRPNAPIEVGEIGSVYDRPGKQTVSITQALFAGQAIGEMLDAGVARSAWWIGNGGCGTNGNLSDSLYGWQEFGGYAIFSDGLPTAAYGGCPNVNETIPFGTLLPTARIYQLLARSGFVSEGEHMLGVTVPPSLPLVRAYAATHGHGYALLLFNLDPQNAMQVPIAIDGVARLSMTSSLSYGKQQYDRSRDGVWAGAVAGKRAVWRLPQTVTVPPYSVTAYTLVP